MSRKKPARRPGFFRASETYSKNTDPGIRIRATRGRKPLSDKAHSSQTRPAYRQDSGSACGVVNLIYDNPHTHQHLSPFEIFDAMVNNSVDNNKIKQVS